MQLTHNYDKFRQELAAELDAVEKQKVGLVRDVGVEMLKRLQDLSPVKTGAYKASHVLSVGQPSKARAVKKDPGGARARGRMAAARSRLARIKDLKRATIFVTNRARHAHLVEDGTGPRTVKKTGRAVGSMPAKKVYARVRQAMEAVLQARLARVGK